MKNTSKSTLGKLKDRS